VVLKSTGSEGVGDSKLMLSKRKWEASLSSSGEVNQATLPRAKDGKLGSSGGGSEGGAERMREETDLRLRGGAESSLKGLKPF